MRFTHTKFIAAGLALTVGSLGLLVLPPTAGAATPAAVRSELSAAARSKLSATTPPADAAGWLGRQFLTSGDLPKSEGEAGVDNEALALLALASAKTGRKQAAAGLGYLEHHFEAFVSIPVSKRKSADLPGRLAEVILAAVATKADPSRFGGTSKANDLVARLLATQATKGSDAGLFGSPVSPTYSSAYTQGLALLALAAVGQPNAAGAQWLNRQQCPSGGWTSYRAATSKRCPTEDPAAFAGADTNSTALALEGLVATKEAPRVSPLRFLESAQYADGGFGYIAAVSASQPVDPDSTALVIQALVALGDLHHSAFTKAHGATPERALRSFQLGCGVPASERGAYRYPGASGPNLYATIQAIPAAMGEAYPIKPATLSPSLPRTTCPNVATTPAAAP